GGAVSARVNCWSEQGPWAVLSGQSGWLLIATSFPDVKFVIIGIVVPPGRLSPGNIGNSSGAVVVLLSPSQKSPVWATVSTVLSSYAFVEMYGGAMLSITSRALLENGTTTTTWVAVALKLSPAIAPPKVTTGLALKWSSDVPVTVRSDPPGGVVVETVPPVKMMGATGASTVSVSPPPETTTHEGPMATPATAAWNLFATGGW